MEPAKRCNLHHGSHRTLKLLSQRLHNTYCAGVFQQRFRVRLVPLRMSCTGLEAMCWISHFLAINQTDCVTTSCRWAMTRQPPLQRRRIRRG